MASLKFRHYATESALKGTNNTVQDALNAFDVGTIVFIDDTQKQYIITSKSNNVVTYKIYYGEAAVVGVSRTDATLTLTLSDGSEITVKINNVEHATSSDTADTAKSVAWNNVTGKPTNFVTTDGTQTITGSKIFTNNVSLQGSTSADSITTEDLIVNGAARFVSGLTGNLKGDVVGNVTGNVTGALTGDATGNAGSATKLQTARNINGTSFNGTASITTAKWGTARTITIADNTNEHTQANNSIDGGANFTLKLPATIKADIIGNASTANTAKSVAWANVTNKPNLVTTDTEQTITGAKIFNNNTTFKNETDVESLTADSLLVTGSARFTNTINGNLKGNVEGNLTGNASTATTAATATEFSANKSVTLTGDVTGSASSKGGWSVATTIANGAVTNAKLANSKITIAGTAVSLGGSIAASTIGAALTTSAPAAYATNAGTATKAAEAEKAIKDSDGNVINTTYIKTVTLASGTKNGTLKLTVGGTTTDNIAVKGLGSAAYTDSESYAKASHIHNYLPLSGGTINGNLKIGAIDNTSYKYLALFRSSHFARINNTEKDAFFAFGTVSDTGVLTAEKVLKIGDNGIQYSPDSSSYYDIIHAGNLTSYAPSLTGSGASGTWGINITGNASSATKATNDGSGNTITSTYATKTERANNDITAASLTASKLTLTRTAGNITANIPTWNQDTTGTAAKATADAKGNNIINTYATKAEVAALPKSMVIKGTLDATHTLPTSGMTEGDTYIVGASGTYNKIACKVGDFFVRTSNSWLRIPAGDEWEYNENTIKGIKVNNAGHADTADTAVSAGSATSDSNGDNIASTYARINKVYDDSGDYRQFLGKNGDSSNWIRTTTTGILPYTSGDSSNGHSSLGTPTWYFSKAYIQNIYGYLNGNISGSSTSCSGNAATATKAGYLDTGGMTLYAHGGNEINFGGTNASSTIYFGYRATESKPIPTSFIFGGSAGTATLTAGGFKKKDSNASYVLTGDGGHAKISGLSVNYATTSGSCSGNSATATKATQDSDGNTINTTYLKRSGGTVTGNVTFNSSVTTDSLTTEDLIVNGSARFVSGLTGDLVGNVTGNLTGTASYATNAGNAASAGTATTSGACTGNAATATKLQTARTIWGQSFDGSRNVSGSLTGVTNIAASGSVFSNNYNANGNTAVAAFIFNKGGDYFGIGPSSGNVSNVGFGTTTNTTGTWKSEMMTITSSGNVGIGTTSPTSKLHVAGTGYFTSDISSAANIIAGGYIKGETVKISSGCTLEYSSTDKCVRFVFN